VPVAASEVRLANVSTRQNGSSADAPLQELPGSERKLIVDVIGGKLDRDTVEAWKGVSKEDNE